MKKANHHLCDSNGDREQIIARPVSNRDNQQHASIPGSDKEDYGKPQLNKQAVPVDRKLQEDFQQLLKDHLSRNQASIYEYASPHQRSRATQSSDLLNSSEYKDSKFQ